MKREDVVEAARRLRSVEAGVRVLRSIAWAPSVRAEFFDRGARELPRVEYEPFDSSAVHAELREATRTIRGESPIADWLRRCAGSIASSADLIAAVGTAEFLRHGERLYGVPASDQGGTTALALARRVDQLSDEIRGLDLGEPPPACHLASGVAERMRAACVELFGNEAPEVVVVDELSANALAGPRRIQIRRDACFTDRDVDQLVQHEAYVHVCTSLNGRHQPELPILAASHAGTTRTQEGLAVFAEYITGSLEPDRLRRLADRVLATQMAIEGADFLDVHRYFLGRGLAPEQAFENARRVFRGGVVSGGAPFTKDVVYLDGFLRITNFFRALVAEGRADVLPLVFCGKLDLEDVPALAQLTEMGLCSPPAFLPPWAADRRFLVTYLAYSQFLSTVRLDVHREHYRDVLAHTPRVHPARSGAGTDAR